MNNPYPEFPLRGYVVSKLRQIFSWWPAKKEVLMRQKRGSKYECEGCHKVFDRNKVQVEHIRPAVDPVEGFVGYDIYINRLFCGLDNLQIMCKPCHKTKSNKENTVRRKVKKEKKTQ